MLSGLHQSKKLKIFGIFLVLSFVFTGAHPTFALEPTYTTDGSPIEHGVNLELSVAPTLQVVIPASTVSLNLTPNPDPSIPVLASSNLVVSVATNNPTGYSLMLKANSTNLTNTVADREGNYATLPTLVDQVGGYTEDSFTTNAWGYRNTNTLLNNIATTTIPGNYNAFTTSSEILSSKLPTNLDQTSLDFAAKVDITQPAGTYELALNFEAVTNVIPGVVTINYDPNTGTGEMAKQQFEVVSPEHLTPNSYTKENYVFIGWNTAKDGSGTNYSNNQLYTIPEGTEETANINLTLYAQWALAMQAVTTAQCTETPTKVADSRDGTVYTIQRLNDGNCWMMGNLMLGSTEPINLTPNDTNITANYTLPASVNSGFTDDTSGRTVARINIDSREITDSYGNRYGTYYNYCAASAGQICMDSNPGQNATQDICPKGWRLPTGGTNGEIQALTTAYNIGDDTAGSIVVQQTLKVPISGAFDDASVGFQGIDGSLWSSTYASNIGMYRLLLFTSNVYPKYGANRRTGFSMRCIMKEPLNNITYMQDITANIINNANEEAKSMLYDKRDNKLYSVAKINNQLWMTQNLDLAGGTTLTSELSNVTSNYTLPASSASGFSDNATAYVYNSNSTTCGDTQPCYSYYSYVAATAGTNPSSSDATSDVCPRNWRLPTKSEWQSMIDIYATGSEMRAAPFMAVYAGNYANGAHGTGGWYWSSTPNDGTTAFDIGIYSNGSVIGASNKHYGFPVRCVAK